MARRSIRDLEDIAGISPRLLVECECGRSGMYDSVQILAYFRGRLWSTVIAHAAARFRCAGTGNAGWLDAHPEHRGCGARGKVTLRPAPQPVRMAPPAPIMGDREIKAEIRRRRG